METEKQKACSENNVILWHGSAKQFQDAQNMPKNMQNMSKNTQNTQNSSKTTEMIVTRQIRIQITHFWREIELQGLEKALEPVPGPKNDKKI